MQAVFGRFSLSWFSPFSTITPGDLVFNWFYVVFKSFSVLSDFMWFLSDLNLCGFMHFLSGFMCFSTGFMCSAPYFDKVSL